jgi:regulatory protein
MHYLERYSASEAQLRRVLQRKVERSCHHHGLDPAGFREMVEAAVAACVASGVVDDRRFAEARVASLRRKGRSARAVSAGLAAKGVARELVAATVQVTEEDEHAAARIAARRKRLGPWSSGDRAPPEAHRRAGAGRLQPGHRPRRDRRHGRGGLTALNPA